MSPEEWLAKQKPQAKPMSPDEWLQSQTEDILSQIPTGIAGVTEDKFSQAQPFEPTLAEQAIGAGEAALTTLTGATGGTVGMIGGTLKGLAEQILSGQFGTQEAADLVEQEAMKSARALTFEPRTEAGQRYTRQLGETLGEVVPPVVPVVGAPGAIGAGIAEVGPAAARAGRAATTAIRATGRPTKSVGTAETPVAVQRITTAEQLPVPFKGESGLTEGQASRDFAQLQFEKESAKLGEVGEPLRERVQNQTATMIQNFDALVDRLEPISVEKRDIGKAVTQAIVNKANVVKKRIQNAYEEAEAAGHTRNPVEMDVLASRFDDLSRFEGLVPTISAVKREAQRLGAITIDENGNVLPGSVPISDAEILRQFVNDATDWTNRRESLIAKRINSAIDQSTENAGGDLYKKARKMRKQFADEFENVGLTAKLLGTKKGTNERQIAFGDVFDKIVLLSPVEEMNKLRSTLLKSGQEGRQAWNDMKAAGIEHIKQSSLSPSQMDAAGNPLLSPDKLNRVIKKLDDQGKLVSLYGKKQAQILRDLAELSSVIYTAPPGAINFSNTASALQVALDSLGTFAVTGIPAPVATTLREATKYIKNRKLKARINKSLNPKGEK